MRRRVVVAGIVAGLAFGALGATLVLAQAAPARTILGAIDVSGATEVATLGTVDFPASGVIGRHTHPGEEVGYVVKGRVVLKVDGQPDRPLRAGDGFVIPRGVVHSAAADSGGARLSVVWITDTGAPLATPAA